MKLLLAFLFLSILHTCFSQDNYQGEKPSVFDTFIKRSTIEWAAFADDTVRFNTPNLSDLLIKRMENREIKTMYPIRRDDYIRNYYDYYTLPFIEFTTTKENHQMFYPCCIDYMYDSLGRVLGDTVQKPRRKIDDRTYDLLWATQILYIENGQLKSYIPWVAPTFSAIVAEQFLGVDTYFGTCLNFKYNFKPASNDNIIFLGETKRMVLYDSVFKTETLKQTYGRNLLQSIWAYVAAGKINVYNSATNKKVLPQDLDYFSLSSQPYSVALYDSFGNEIGTKYKNPNPIPYYITEVEIVQQWYYNYTKNIVTCKIPGMFLYAGRDDNNNPVKADKPVLKILFK
jgi:hypothetical protein